MAFYENFQLIGYHVPTNKQMPAGPACKLSEESEAAIEPYLSGKGLGDLKDPVPMGQDAQYRLRRMIAVVELAYSSKEIETASSTLKVFMAPEFYFQPWVQGDYNNEANNLPPRCYSERDANLLLSALSHLFMTDKRWLGWLFVFGTIIWESDAKNYLDAFEEVKDLKNVEDENDVLKVSSPFSQDELQSTVGKKAILNTSIVIEGKGVAVRFDKRNYADFDHIPTAVQPRITNDAFNKIWGKSRGKLRAYIESMLKLNDQACIFTVGENLLVGAEICLDHSVGVLKKNAYPAFLKTQVNPKAITLQLLTCCGMELLPDSMALGVNGLAFKMDGSCYDNHPRSEVHRVVEVKNLAASKVEQITNVAERILLQPLGLELDPKDIPTIDAEDKPFIPLGKRYVQELVIHKAVPAVKA